MTLLREFISLDYDKEVIKEAKEKGSPVIIKKALLQRCSTPNQNNRVYSRQVLEREIENYKKLIEENRALGEADHPESSVVELKNASHIIRSIWWEGDEVWGSVEILNTPAGKIIQSLMESQVRIGISSRGVGETHTNEEGYDEVDESFALLAFDLVSEPSTHNAFLSEGVCARNNQVKYSRLNSIISEILNN